MKIYVSSGIRTHTTPVHDGKVSALDRSATLVRYQVEHLYRITGIFCGCLIFAEFYGSIQIAEIKNRKIFQSSHNDEIVSGYCSVAYIPMPVRYR